MATLPGRAISASYELEDEPQVMEAALGDLYAQRAGRGFNAMGRRYRLVWEGLSLEEMQVLRTFFRDRGGHQSFQYQPPEDDGAANWVCTRWPVTRVSALIYRMQAELTETFG